MVRRAPYAAKYGQQTGPFRGHVWYVSYDTRTIGYKNAQHALSWNPASWIYSAEPQPKKITKKHKSHASCWNFPSPCTPVTPSAPAATEWTRLLSVFCSVWRTPYHALSIGMTQQFFVVFVPGDLDLWPLTLTFKLLRARDQTRPCIVNGNDSAVFFVFFCILWNLERSHKVFKIMEFNILRRMLNRVGDFDFLKSKVKGQDGQFSQSSDAK